MRTRSVLAALAAPVLIAGAALAASAGPALAAQSNIKIPVGAQIDVGTPGCVPGDVVITVASGHDNFVQTPNGFHENATIQGTAQLIDFTTSPPTVLATGHGEAWFTTNLTNGASVQTDVVNAQIGGTKIHLAGTFVVDANGNIRVNNNTATCH